MSSILAHIIALLFLSLFLLAKSIIMFLTLVS